MPERKLLLVFPGQGAQYAGMGSDLVAEFGAAGRIYERASEVLGYDVQELSFRDPRGELGKTRFTQPALLTHEIACYESLRELAGEAFRVQLAAGHSLGEYSALVAAGALTFEAAVALVRARGELMSEHGGGGMAATTLDLAAAGALAEKHFCAVAGSNLPDQTVVGGEAPDLERLIADLEQSFPGKRAVKLATEGAFHTYLMVTAAREFRAVLERTEFAQLAFGVLSNYTGALHDPEASAMRSRLFFQLFNPVRWVSCMAAAIDFGVDTIVELGGGIGKGEGPEGKRPNLEGIVKKSLKSRQRDAQYLPAVNAAGIRAAAEQLKAA